MTTTEIPRPAAEALAKALRENGWQKTTNRLCWETSRPTTRERHMTEAYSLIAAALPHLLTEVKSMCETATALGLALGRKEMLREVLERLEADGGVNLGAVQRALRGDGE